MDRNTPNPYNPECDKIMYCDPGLIRGFKSAKNEEIKKIVNFDLIIVPFIPQCAETTFE
jgi:hypothetical protein